MKSTVGAGCSCAYLPGICWHCLTGTVECFLKEYSVDWWGLYRIIVKNRIRPVAYANNSTIKESVATIIAALEKSGLIKSREAAVVL